MENKKKILNILVVILLILTTFEGINIPLSTATTSVSTDTAYMNSTVIRMYTQQIMVQIVFL